MTLGLIGTKIGMTREFFDSGISIPVTVVKVEKVRVIFVLLSDIVETEIVDNITKDDILEAINELKK